MAIPTAVVNALNQVQTDADAVSAAQSGLTNAQAALSQAEAAVPQEEQAVSMATAQLTTDYQALLQALAQAYGQTPAPPSPAPALAQRK